MLRIRFDNGPPFVVFVASILCCSFLSTNVVSPAHAENALKGLLRQLQQGSGKRKPSFDCRTAENATEIAICKYPDLSALDRSLAKQYAKLLTNPALADRARVEQRQWLQTRDSCGPAHDCIRSAIQERLRQVRSSPNGTQEATIGAEHEEGEGASSDRVPDDNVQQNEPAYANSPPGPEHPDTPSAEAPASSASSAGQELPANITTPAPVAIDRSPADFDSAPEPDYRSLLALFVTGNSDLLDTPAFAWQNLMINHVADSSRGGISDECVQLTRKAANEFDLARIVEDAQRLLKEDLGRAAGQPKTRVFKMHQRISLGTYDTAEGTLPFANRESITILGAARPLHIKRDFNDGRSVYDGPTQGVCMAWPGGIGKPNKLAGNETLPGDPSLAIKPVEGVDRIKLSPADAEALLARQKSGPGGMFQSRYAELEVLVEVGPAIINPKEPGVIPAHVIAARVKDATTNAVVYNFDIPTAASPEKSEANRSDRVAFSSKAMALAALRERPEIMNDAAAANLARQQVYAEQSCYANLDKLGSSDEAMRNRMQSDHIDPHHPIFALSWASLKDAKSQQRNAVEQVFYAPNASWDFLTSDPDYDARLNHFVEAFIFDKDSVRDREVGVAAQELAPLFKEHALSVAQQAPSQFTLTTNLANLIYDPKDRALHTESNVPVELLAPSTGGSYTEAEVQTRIIYGPLFGSSESEPQQWPGAYSGCQHPAANWRNTIARLVTGGTDVGLGLPYAAFDRRLSFTHLKIEPEKMAKLIRNANGMVSGLKARINFSLDGVSVLQRPSNTAQNDLIFRLRLDDVDLLDPTGQNVLTTIASTEFEDGAAIYADLTRQEAQQSQKEAARNAAASFDVLGIKLGMPYAEAKAKALAELGEGSTVLHTKPMRDTLAGDAVTSDADGILGPFVYGTLVRGDKGDDQVAFYVDPTDPKLPVIGVSRILPFPREFPTAQEIQAALGEKYGKLSYQFYEKYVYFYDRQSAYEKPQVCGYYDHPGAALFFKEGDQSTNGENGPGLEFRGANSGSENCGTGIAANVSGNGHISVRMLDEKLAVDVREKLGASVAARKKKETDELKSSFKLKL
jgi:uncharacterized protein YecT (DUF1311 family)